jgi:hypothetical protein
LLNVVELENVKFPEAPGPFAVNTIEVPLAAAVTGELGSPLKSAASSEATVLAAMKEG